MVPLASPTLGTLSLSSTVLPSNVSATINIIGATFGSTITVQTGTLPTGMTLNSAARTISGTPTVGALSSFTLRETLAGATNTPHDTPLSIQVNATADFLVTNDAQFATANTSATAGQIIQLQDSGVFTDLTLTNATGVTVRGQTPGVPVLRSLYLKACVAATVTGLKIQPNATPVGAPKLLGVSGNINNLVIDNMTIHGGNPNAGFANFDPTFNDTAAWGTVGNWGSTNPYGDLWYAIGQGIDGAISGNFTIQNCNITDVGAVMKFTYQGGGSIKILNNTCGRFYNDCIAFGPTSSGSAITAIEICGNEFFDGFSQPQDNLNPHTDLIQLYGDDVPPSFYNFPIPVLIAGNIAWYTPGGRGQSQRMFFSDNNQGAPFYAPVIVDNLFVSRITDKGIHINNFDNGQTGSVYGYIYRNTIVSNPNNNTPFQNEVFTNTTSGIGPSSGLALASINLVEDPTYPAPYNYIASNISEQAINNTDNVLSGNINIGRGSNATSYGIYANPTTTAAWNALASANDYVVAFQTIATNGVGKGVGIGGTSAASIRSTWAIAANRPWTALPSFVTWAEKTAAAPSTSYDSDWALYQRPGGGTDTVTPAAGTQINVANDVSGTGAIGFTSSAVSVTDKQYVKLRKTSSGSPAQSVQATASNVAGVIFSWTITTVSTSAYPVVDFDGADRFFATYATSSDSRYLTFGMRMKFPAANPTTGYSIFTSVQSGGSGGTGPIGVSLLTTGLLRIFIQNAAGTNICTLNMTAGSLCDGGTHTVLITLDMDQATAANGRLIYVDDVDRTSATGTWAGGTGVTIGYSRTTTNAFTSIGGLAAIMMTGQPSFFYCNRAERADITLSGTRNKFDASLIGANGNGVTGNQPFDFVTGIASQWNDPAGINWGSSPNKFIAQSGSAVTAVSGSAWP